MSQKKIKLILLGRLNALFLTILLLKNPLLITFSVVFAINCFLILSVHLFFGLLNIVKDYSSNTTFNFIVTVLISTAVSSALFLFLA
jgi:succinate dehydrogenase hydrophobic anchor subunit